MHQVIYYADHFSLHTHTIVAIFSSGATVSDRCCGTLAAHRNGSWYVSNVS